MTDFEKTIYNKFLKISKVKQNKPYKLRQNFEGFEDTEDGMYVKKLAIFFDKYKHIKIDDFFEAPYFIYDSSTEYYGLKFYCSYNAAKVYALYEKKILQLSPDTDIMYYRTIEGIQYIRAFCKEQNISCKEYFNHVSDKCKTFWIHLKHNYISVYCLFLCNDIMKIYNKSDHDVLDFMLDGLMSNFTTYKGMYNNSVKTKKLISEIKPYFNS